MLIYNTAASDPITFSITGGNDASLFDIDSVTGALSFKTAVTADSVSDFNKDGVYNVQVTATSGSTNKAGNIAISVSTDTTLASYSNLKLVQSTNSQGESVVYITGNLSDDSAALKSGQISINMRHETKGSNLYFNADNPNISDDGSFQTNSQTLTSAVPDGTWFVENITLEDDSGNQFSEYFRGGTETSPLKATVVNAIYLGNSDTTLPSYSDLALKVEDGKLSITGKLTDDGAPLNVGEVSIRIQHTVTGTEKWFNTQNLNADGTFETYKEDLRSSDPSGKWVLEYIRVKDDAGNELEEHYYRGDDSNPLQATLTNDLYLGSSDDTAASARNFNLVQTTNYEGKAAIQITGLLEDDGAALTSGEIGIEIKHTKSGKTLWLDARDSQIDSNGNFETWLRTLEADIPSGTWFIANIRIKDDAGNQSNDRYQAQDSSPYKFSLVNDSYTGGQAGDGTGSDYTAPTFSNLDLTVSNDGDGTSTLTFSGIVADTSGVDHFRIRLKNSGDAAAEQLHIHVNDSDINNETGAFSVTRQLDSTISGTWIVDDWQLEDEIGNYVGGYIDSGSTGSPLLGLSFAWTNSNLDSSDKSVPVLSNLTATKVNDGDDTYTLKVTGNAVDSSDVTWVQIRFKNINDPNADTFWLSTSSFDSEGAFTMNRSLDNDNGGTWIADYIQAKDALGNQFNQEIRSGGDGSPLGDLTFDITSSTENSSDASAPSFSNFTSSIAADGDGTYTINIAGKVIDDSTVNNVNFRFNSSTDGSHFWQSINSGSIDSSGNFTMAINAENINPGKYYLSYLTARDASGNEYSKDIRDGGSGSPIENLTFNYAAEPTDISFTEQYNH